MYQPLYLEERVIRPSGGLAGERRENLEHSPNQFRSDYILQQCIAYEIRLRLTLSQKKELVKELLRGKIKILGK